jgi:predicted ATP-dependent endonuclease of OLD family
LKIKSVIIENFRSIKQLQLNFKDLVMIIGENNSGKTNILKALSLFFSSSVRGMCIEDFCDKKTQNEIKITITFDRLTASESSNIKIKKYLSNGELTVQKSFYCDQETGKYESKFSGLIREPKAVFLKLSKFEEYKANLAKIVRENKLPEYFKNEKGNVTQASYKEGLKRYVEENGDKLEWDNPFFSITQFLGWKEVATDFLSHFFYIPAVMEATEESQYSGRNLFGRLIDALFLETPDSKKEFSDLEKLLTKIGTRLNRPIRKQKDKRPQKIITFEKTILTVLQESMPSIKDVEIEVTVPKIKEIVQSGTEILLDDGIKTSVQSKGHGLQRALIFAIFREYAKLRKSETNQSEAKSIVFAIEEPELYLHPHRQVALFQILQDLSDDDQILFCTHSPYFIDMSQYTSLILITKSNSTIGTKGYQCETEIFSKSEKEQFKLINEFSPERNEIFFAKKVILVEGPSEKLSLPILGKKLGLNFYDSELSVVECNGKANIPFFMKALNAFKLKYLVIHDVDPIDETETDEEKKKHRLAMFGYNQKIADSLEPALGKIVPIDPEFDELLGVSKHQLEKFGKRYAIFCKCTEMKPEDIPEELAKIVRSCIS